jgi:hypothetical protein
LERGGCTIAGIKLCKGSVSGWTVIEAGELEGKGRSGSLKVLGDVGRGDVGREMIAEMLMDGVR